MPFKVNFLIPYESYDIVTELSPEEIADRLDEVIAPYNDFAALNRLSYTGRVSEDSFKFRDGFTGRSIFWRTTVGTVREIETGSVIHVKVRPPLGSTIFATLLFLLVTLAATPTGWAIFTGFIYFLAMMDAKIGSKKAKENLLDWVDGDVV